MSFLYCNGSSSSSSSIVIVVYLHKRKKRNIIYPSHVDMFLSEVTNCVAAVADWMQSNCLQLNDNKTEVIWCTMGRRQHRLPTAGPTIGCFSATPASTVRDLGVYIDSAPFTCQCAVTSGEPCGAVLPLFASYAPSGVKFQPPCSSLWLPHLFCLT